MKAFFTKAWTIIKTRITSPVVLIALVANILVVAQVTPENVTSWPLLWTNIVVSLSNPVIVAAMIVELVAFFNNPADKVNW